jgi:hypothetical protein
MTGAGWNLLELSGFVLLRGMKPVVAIVCISIISAV